MTWNLSNIPRTCHVYWGADKLPYMRYLTVRSFMRFNPDWRVVLWLPKHPSVKRTWDSDHQNYEVECDDYYDKLLALPIEKRYVDFSQFGMTEEMSEVHKSDYLRLYLLAYWGGLWSDMDIIYFRPMSVLAVNTPENKDVETFVCINNHHAYRHSGGFLMSARNSAYFKTLMGMVEYEPNVYQGMGVDMFNKLYPTIESIQQVSSAVNIGMEAVYAHDATHVKEIIFGKTARFGKRSVGIHWYGGNALWGEFIKRTNGGLENLPDTIIGNLIKIFSNEI